MGKTIVDVKLWNFLDEDKIKSGEIMPVEIACQIDNGATEVVFPEKLAKQLNLKKNGKTKVKYLSACDAQAGADERVEEKDIALGLRIEIMGRDTICRAIVEPKRTTPLIGQIILEGLDLWIDSKNGKLIPNPESPDAPLMEILWTKGGDSAQCTGKMRSEKRK